MPEHFESTVVFQEVIRAQTFLANHALQVPEVVCCLSSLSDYEGREGDTALERILSSIGDFGDSPTLVDRYEVDLHGQKSLVQEATIDWEWAGKKARVHYFVGAVVLDGFCYVMNAYCESDVVVTYRPLFLETWGTLTWFGDPVQVLLDAESAARQALALSDEPPVVVVATFEPPDSDQGLFHLAGRDWGLWPAECSAEISSSSHDLSVTLRANLQKSMPDYQDLVDYEDEGLGFSLSFKSICRQGCPEGNFEFEFGKSQDSNVSLSDQGWEYSLEFSGQVTLRDGWLGLRGVMSKEYEPEFAPREIQVYYKICEDQLDWRHYEFTSLDETAGMPFDQVRHLSLTEPSFTTLPAAVFDFTALESLSISRQGWYGGDSDKLPLVDLTERFGELSRLRVLHIHGAGLSELPASFARLIDLTQVYLSHCLLWRIPDDFWSLRNLQHVSLNNNRLQRLPDSGDLPSLESLGLEGNELTVLPDWLLDCPNLRSLDLSDNPWQALHRLILDIPNLTLEIAQKLKLFDFSYPGADGQGTVPWDDDAFFLRSDPNLRQRFVAALGQGENAKFESALLAVARKTVYLAPGQSDTYERLGATRFGGLPDLPRGMAYPTYESDGVTYHYDFLAQLDCGSLAALQSYLPRQGTLLFFIDNWEACRPLVLFHPGASDDLVSGSTLSATALNLWDDGTIRTAVTAEASLGWSLPSDYAAFVNPHLFPDGSLQLLEHDGLTSAITEELNGHESRHHHEVNGYVFTQHESPELQAALKLRGRPEDWTVLLKVASLGEFQWWDAGDLFFVIHKSDLQKAEFSNIYASIESS
jgi:uncharacterized protein YwqG